MQTNNKTGNAVWARNFKTTQCKKDQHVLCSNDICTCFCHGQGEVFGMDVRSDPGQLVGTLKFVHPSGREDVFVIKGDGVERVIDMELKVDSQEEVTDEPS